MCIHGEAGDGSKGLMGNGLRVIQGYKGGG